MRYEIFDVHINRFTQSIAVRWNESFWDGTLNIIVGEATHTFSGADFIELATAMIDPALSIYDNIGKLLYAKLILIGKIQGDMV